MFMDKLWWITSFLQLWAFPVLIANVVSLNLKPLYIVKLYIHRFIYIHIIYIYIIQICITVTYLHLYILHLYYIYLLLSEALYKMIILDSLNNSSHKFKARESVGGRMYVFGRAGELCLKFKQQISKYKYGTKP